jgi:Putative prokaryotic signal transducing protein
MANWTPIHTARDRHEAEVLRGRLEANDIPAMVMDQRSSVYPSMGAIQVLVDRDDVLRAIHLISQHNEP